MTDTAAVQQDFAKAAQVAEAVQAAQAAQAAQGSIVILGATFDKPETGYGYI